MDARRDHDWSAGQGEHFSWGEELAATFRRGASASGGLGRSGSRGGPEPAFPKSSEASATGESGTPGTSRAAVGEIAGAEEDSGRKASSAGELYRPGSPDYETIQQGFCSQLQRPA